MTDKMRLILWPECDRDCPGCCNKSIDMSTVPHALDFKGYREIILTGGEPLLYPDMVRELTCGIRSIADPDTRVLLYTANYDSNAHSKTLYALDGMTITLHEQADVEPFMYLYAWMLYTKVHIGKTMRLNVFEGITHPNVSDVFSVKSGIRWIKNCPLPEGEVLMRWM